MHNNAFLFALARVEVIQIEIIFSLYELDWNNLVFSIRLFKVAGAGNHFVARNFLQPFLNSRRCRSFVHILDMKL
jgi:hypothetical protein